MWPHRTHDSKHHCLHGYTRETSSSLRICSLLSFTVLVGEEAPQDCRRSVFEQLTLQDMTDGPVRLALPFQPHPANPCRTRAPGQQDQQHRLQRSAQPSSPAHGQVRFAFVPVTTSAMLVAALETPSVIVSKMDVPSFSLSMLFSLPSCEFLSVTLSPGRGQSQELQSCGP
jgi:hypothetical protein